MVRHSAGANSQSFRIPAIVTAVLMGIALLLLYLGWKEFWFMTDDAYIAFRYVSNEHFGHGLVWNVAPFHPVEGYTSFLWVLLLDLVWRLTGVLPPSAANPLAFLFSSGTLLLTVVAAYRFSRLHFSHLVSYAMAGLSGVYLLSNPTFLTWASSGLETALFNFLLLAWGFSMLFISERSRFRLFLICLTATLAYLTRPDGLLLVIATLLLAAATYRSRQPGRTMAGYLVSLAPLLAIPTHLVWRKLYYGEWVPNTYFAKHVSAWPEAGMRYLASFLIEYGLWFWLSLLLVALVTMFFRFLRRLRTEPRFWSTELLKDERVSSVLVVGTLIVHSGYYIVDIGGDHFEWRVLSHLFPYIFLATLWTCCQLRFKTSVSFLMVILVIGLSLPIPWSYHTAERKVTHLRVADTYKPQLSGRLPWFVSPFSSVQDRLQSWLQDHLVCIRRIEHHFFLRNQLAVYPERRSDVPQQSEPYPVAYFTTVGVPGWVMPEVNIIDGYGLNDRVIAHSHAPANAERHMAHDRIPPKGYVESFCPNVGLGGVQDIRYMGRQPGCALDSVRLVKLEAYWYDHVVLHDQSADSSVLSPNIVGH